MGVKNKVSDEAKRATDELKRELQRINEYRDHIPRVKPCYRAIPSWFGEEAREAIMEIYKEMEMNNKP